MRNEMMAVGLNRSASRLDADSSSASSVPATTMTRAAQRQLQPPAVADAVDDVDELRATVGAARFRQACRALSLHVRIHRAATENAPAPTSSADGLTDAARSAVRRR